MRVIKIQILAFVVWGCNLAAAATDLSCLDGGMGQNDYECYAYTIKYLDAENNSLIDKVIKKMPSSQHASRRTLEGYRVAMKRRFSECELIRQGQKPVGEAPNHVHYYDVMYSECVYSKAKHDNEFLKKVYDAWFVR